MAPAPFPRPFSLLSRHLSTSSDHCWKLLRSHSPPPPLETTLSNSIPNPTHSFITSILTSVSSASDHHLALRFFVWAGLHPLHRHSVASYSAAASLLRLPLHPHLLHRLLDSYLSDRSPVSSKTFHLLFTLCRHADLPFPFALSLLRRMGPHFACRPDLPAYNALLRLPSATASDADALLGETRDSGLRPDVITYVTVIKKLCAAGRLEDARDLLVRMRADGCSPNVVVYSALLDGACGCSDLSAALEILEQMEGEEDRECAPNVVSYTCLMKCLCETGKLEEALGVLDRMGQNGCQPNRVTLRTLLKGFCEKGRVGDAYKIVETVISKEGGVSSEECYSLLMVCLLRVGDWEAAKGLLQRMVERGVRPDGLACNSFMREICEKRCFLDGYNWIGVLEEKGMDCVDSDVYSCLLAGLCGEGHFVEAVKLGRKIVENGVRIEDSHVDCVVEAMEKIEEGELASHMMRMKEENKSQLNMEKQMQ